MALNRNFWQGKRVVVTGHTGFKGAWLAIWLHRLGARVTGIGLPPTTDPNLFGVADVGMIIASEFCDIRDVESLTKLISRAQPEVVFHLAAQALVRASYRDPLATFATNVQGTANVLDALRPLDSVRAAILVTTDKVYKNTKQPFPYRETDVLGGYDPYSASKAAAEIVIDCYRHAFFSAQNVSLASVRAGNVIGGGDWSEDRLIPDAVRAWSTNQKLSVRRPHAVRPWQHVLEPLSAYMELAERMWAEPTIGGSYNFGPDPHKVSIVREVVELARASFGGGDVVWGDGTDGPHEADYLTLETAKARAVLGITPRWSLPESVERTLAWYRKHRELANARDLCEEDITAYEAAGP